MIFIGQPTNHAKADAIAPTTERLKANPEKLTRMSITIVSCQESGSGTIPPAAGAESMPTTCLSTHMAHRRHVSAGRTGDLWKCQY